MIGRTACVLAATPAFVWVEEIADVSDGFPEVIDGPGADAPEVSLEFGKGRIEVGTGGQEKEALLMPREIEPGSRRWPLE